MTVGEKIQYYRKKNGLSQEELGQKMLVSRQTVSLWEMDKTLPTVDNLIRLKEFFSVSIDEILTDTEPKVEKQTQPKETYVFKYNKEDLDQILKKDRFRYVKRRIISTLLCVILLICFSEPDNSGFLLGILSACFFIGLITCIKDVSLYRTTCKKTKDEILKNTYSYEIFKDGFILQISRHDEIIKMTKVYYDEIEEIQSYRNYFLIHAGGQRYIIKKDVPDPRSPLLAFCKDFQNKSTDKKPWDKFKTVSLILFLLSIGTIGCAMFVVFLMTANNKAMVENMWAFFLFVPIPIASIIYGFYLKKKGYKYKKNIIIGIIMAILLCIYGSFTFLFPNVYSHSDEAIRNAEQLLGIDIPKHSQINTQDWTVGTQSVPRGYIYSTTDIYFEDVDVKEFESSLEADDKWLSSIPAGIVGITSYFCETHASDYYMIYNKDTGEFNKLPPENGTYDYVNILYDAEHNTMKLVEYQIAYAE